MRVRVRELDRKQFNVVRIRDHAFYDDETDSAHSYDGEMTIGYDAEVGEWTIRALRQLSDVDQDDGLWTFPYDEWVELRIVSPLNNLGEGDIVDVVDSYPREFGPLPQAQRSR